MKSFEPELSGKITEDFGRNLQKWFLLIGLCLFLRIHISFPLAASTFTLE